MAFKQITLNHTTTIGTFVIVSLSGTSKEDFVNALREALNAATPTPLQRDTDVVSQELLFDETQADVNTCLWSLRFNGIHAPDAVRTKCQAIYEGVREKVEEVGTRASFRLETLQSTWDVD
jgi:hypothetical protein